MKLLVQPDYPALANWAADYMARLIRRAGEDPARPIVLGLPTGSTPLGVYERLIALHRQGKLSFRHVITFNMDEYAGLPSDHPQSYAHFMWTRFFKHIDMLPENIHLLDGMAKNPKQECMAYEEKILRCGGIDLFLGGIGANGHVAFNEPGSSLVGRTSVKILRPETRQANARFFGGDIRQVPKKALTVGVGTVMDAREVVIMASGRHKAEAVHQVVSGRVSRQWTASAIRRHPKSILVCDREALGRV